MSKIITIKNITEKDISRLREFVSQTPPLGLHTAYTYWVICHFFKDYSYIAESDNKIIGIRLCLRIKDSLFFWQGGVAENFRRQGLAQELINTAVINGKKAGVTILHTCPSSICVNCGVALNILLRE